MVTDKKKIVNSIEVIVINPTDKIEKNRYPKSTALIKVHTKFNFLFFILTLFNNHHQYERTY